MSKLYAVVVVLPLVFTSLACPTRTIQPDKDGGLGGSAGASAGQTGAGVGGLGGVAGSSVGGASGAPAGGAGGSTTGGVGAAGAGGAAGVPGSGGASGVAGTAGGSGAAGAGGNSGGGGHGGHEATGSGGVAGGGGGNGGASCLTGACGTTCKPGVYDCATGTAVCSHQMNAAVGITCGTNEVCDGIGTCVGKTADGGSCTNSQLCQNGNCAKSGSTGICCPVNYVNCGGSCIDLQSNANNCGVCGSSCGNGLGCASGQCGCTASTLNGSLCWRPGQVGGVCWGGACVLPAYFSGCNSAADCVPGGCTGPGGYCLGTVDVAGQVSCSSNNAEYVVCPASQGCGHSNGNPNVFCGPGGNGTFLTCDGPSDCPANNDCCSQGMSQFCAAQPQPGVIGSACAALNINPNAPQAGVVCDPLNPKTTCPVGQSCGSYFGGTLVSFSCR